jgi:hypothetical protein
MHPICTKIDKNILIKNSKKMVTHPRQRLWPWAQSPRPPYVFFFIPFEFIRGLFIFLIFFVRDNFVFFFNKRGTLQFFNGLEGYYFN